MPQGPHGEADSGCVPRLPITPRPHAEGAGRCKTLHFRGTNMSLLFNRIRQARRGAELSQSELATIVGVARSAVAQWERRDGAKPTTDNMAKIAMATAVSFEWLATGRGGRWLGGDAETPAMMLNFYAQCGLEERLLLAFRTLRSPEQQPLVDFVEAMTDRA